MCASGVFGFSFLRYMASSVVGFARARPRGRWVHPSSLGSLTHALEIVGFIRGHWFRSPANRRSLGSTVVVRVTGVGSRSR